MPSALKMTGMDQFKKWRQAAKPSMKQAMFAATVEVLISLERWAKEILGREIYDKERRPGDHVFTNILLNSFILNMPVQTGLRVKASIENQAPYAGWIEFGSDEHDIPLIAAEFLHWLDPESGDDYFSDKPVHVSGIPAIHFMEKAFSEHITDIEAIYTRHFHEALTNVKV
jgi:hypothetical protein